MYKIYLKNILDIDEEKKFLVREIRNTTFVNSQMYTDHQITFDEHSQWLKNLNYNNKQCVFVVIYKINENFEKILGIVSLNNINISEKKTDWAFYLSQKNIYGLGPTIEYSLIDYVFSNNFKQLNCEVLETNPQVINLHKKFLFKERNNLEKFVMKKGKKVKIVYLGLNLSQWKEKRLQVKKKYSRIFENFEVNFDKLNEKYKS